VEYRTLGSGQQPRADFKDDLAAFCRLDEEQRNTIVEWFLSSGTYELYEPHLPPTIAASTLLPEQFRQAAGVIKNLLYGWQTHGLELQDVERDLLLLGCDAEQTAILSSALDRLHSTKEQVWVEGRKEFERSVGLPTIDDVNIVWNARPAFGGDAFYYYDSVSNEALYDTFLGLVYLATMEISASDNNRDNKQRIAIQMNEQTFERLLSGMKRAGDQLKVLKMRTKTVSADAGEPKGGK
jgi:hypothetical protein